MTLPPVHLPVSKSVLIGLVALIHITLVSVALAGPLVAVVFEFLGVKKSDERYDRLAHGLIPLVIEATVIGGIFGSAMVVLFLGLYPVLIAAIFNVFFWFLVLQLLAGYLINLLFMALYYLRWDAMANRKGAHMLLGLVAGLAPLLVAIVFTAGVTFMATPGKWVETGNVWHGVFNPTFWPALLHRLLAAVAIVGALIVVKAVWKAKKVGTGDPQRVFEAAKGARLAAWASILQVVPGVWYVLALPETGRAILFGEALIPWILGLLAGVVAVILFLIYGRADSSGLALGPLWIGVVLVVAAIWFMGWTRSMTRGKDLIAGVMDAQENLVITPPAFKIPVSGEAIFSQKCGSCHPGLAGDAFSKAAKFKTDEELAAFLTDPMAAGVSMPPVRLSDEEMQALIRYLRSGGKEKGTEAQGGEAKAEKPTIQLGEVVVLAWNDPWNDLGMHCYDDDESVFCILPPYQTLWAQVIVRGGKPKIVTEGYAIRYAFDHNTTSRGKTNFWDYAEKLFGAKLEQDVGLKGFGLTGEMEPAGDHFVAEGIPLTANLDDGTFEPFQTALIEVLQSGKVVFNTETVAPTSPEINCSFCHAPGQNATKAEVREAILKL
ncbi:MAG: hypothetical protein GXO73_03325, partial [Calditrichaeota bacterium]|nr:hypothetical protein [Calditrichota bacterium]